MSITDRLGHTTDYQQTPTSPQYQATTGRAQTAHRPHSVQKQKLFGINTLSTPAPLKTSSSPTDIILATQSEQERDLDIARPGSHHTDCPSIPSLSRSSNSGSFKTLSTDSSSPASSPTPYTHELSHHFIFIQSCSTCPRHHPTQPQPPSTPNRSAIQRAAPAFIAVCNLSMLPTARSRIKIRMIHLGSLAWPLRAVRSSCPCPQKRRTRKLLFPTIIRVEWSLSQRWDASGKVTQVSTVQITDEATVGTVRPILHRFTPHRVPSILTMLILTADRSLLLLNRRTPLTSRATLFPLHTHPTTTIHRHPLTLSKGLRATVHTRRNSKGKRLGPVTLASTI